MSSYINLCLKVLQVYLAGVSVKSLASVRLGDTLIALGKEGHEYLIGEVEELLLTTQMEGLIFGTSNCLDPPTDEPWPDKNNYH